MPSDRLARGLGRIELAILSLAFAVSAELYLIFQVGGRAADVLGAVVVLLLAADLLATGINVWGWSM